MPNLTDAYKLFMAGTNALSRMSANGFKIDRGHYLRTEPEIKQQTAILVEELLSKTEIGRAWDNMYGDRLNLESGDQFKKVLKSIGFTQFKLSDKGNESADVEVIKRLPSEFSLRYIKYKQLSKAYSTYVLPILREASEDDYIHADFLLDGVKTYRSSCRNPNLQNQPIRNKMLMDIVRKGFIPRAADRVLLDMDLKGAECAIGACIHKDPNMLAYVTDDSLDMHRDGAMRVFMVDLPDMTKEIRNACKGDFTFAEFYGASYKTVAPNLWEYVLDESIKLKSGKSLKEHLYGKGIMDLDSFSSHIQRVERQFWGEMFGGYSKWKEDIWQEYCDKGYLQVITGFYLTQLSTKEQILNAPIQGPSFHFLLNILIRMMQKMIKYKMRSLMIAQIHDAISFDAVVSEIDDILSLYWECQDEVRKQWRWVTIPLRAEYSITDPGCPWSEIKDIGYIERRAG